MPRRSKASRLPPAIASALRAALLSQDAVIPLTPEEVAAFDARHPDLPPPPPPPRAPSPRFSWEKELPPEAAEIVGFPALPPGEPLARAARGKEPISPETRRQLSRLVEEMKEDRPNG